MSKKYPKKEEIMSRNIRGRIFLSVKETAEQLDVHPNTIRHWIHKGNGNRIKHIVDPVTGRLLFPKKAVDNIIKKFSKTAEI